MFFFFYKIKIIFGQLQKINFILGRKWLTRLLSEIINDELKAFAYKVVNVYDNKLKSIHQIIIYFYHLRFYHHLMKHLMDSVVIWVGERDDVKYYMMILYKFQRSGIFTNLQRSIFFWNLFRGPGFDLWPIFRKWHSTIIPHTIDPD